MLSCGTPNAYYYKFNCGGLFALIKEYSSQQNNCYVRSEAGFHDSLLIRERFDLASSQAIAILATSFVNDVGLCDATERPLRHILLSLTSSLLDNHIFQQWLTSGYPVSPRGRADVQIMFSSLLSMYSKEKAMILDSLVAIASLRSVKFRIHLRRVGLLSPLSRSVQSSV